MKSLAAACLVTLVALAGCSEPAGVDAEPELATAVITGRVFDATFVPVVDAIVTLGGTDEFDITDAEGGFRIEVGAGLEVYALRVEAQGFHPATRSLQSTAAAPMLNENITLVRLPIEQPYHETQKWEGNIVCAGFVQAQHSHGGPGDPGSHNSNDCSQGTNEEVHEFLVRAGVRNVLLEMQWDPNTVVSERLALFVEGPGLDEGRDVLFDFNEGPTGLRGMVTQLQARTYYADDGPLRVTVKIGAPEEDVALGAAVNQPFTVYATAFYVAPGDSDFSLGAPA